MKSWEERPTEEAHLFNPAFCGEIIRRSVFSYCKSSEQPFQYPLFFLILPLALHKATRERISDRTREQFHGWLQSNPEVRYGFAERARSLTAITRESVAFLLMNQSMSVSSKGEFSITSTPKALSSLQIGVEVRDCFRKGEIVGKWLARSGSVANIYTMLGVSP